MFYAKVYITLKKSIADPQGNAIKEALLSMEYDGVKDVRMGKLIEIKLADKSSKEAEKRVRDMCDTLLANTVIEDYTYDILEVQP
ncbi:MAG: phosphoribosylformylglycinamidine synthase subunit PurS [Bacillota bacterium]